MSSEKHLVGDLIPADIKDFGIVDFTDTKINFITSKIVGKSVLDIGCVQHNPNNYKSKYWLHKAITEKAKNVLGIDLYEPGVFFLKEKGFNIKVADATNFNLREKFDVIVAGDLIEHIDNPSGFLKSCKKHLTTNGKLLLTTPNPWFWKTIAESILRRGAPRVNAEHTAWFCPRTLATLLNRHGFKINHFEFGSRNTIHNMLPLPTGIKHTTIFVEACAN